MLSFPREGHFPSCSRHTATCRCTERGYFWLTICALALWPFELFGGLLAGSRSLVGDSVHVLSDAAIYSTAWLGLQWARERNHRQVLLQKTAMVVRFILIGTALGIIGMAWYQLAFSHEEIFANYDPEEALFFGIPGVLANLWMYLFLRGFAGLHTGAHHHGKEESGIHLGALIHTLGDLFGSIAVVICAIGVLHSDWSPLSDRYTAILIGIIIIAGVFLSHKHSAHEDHDDHYEEP